MVANAREPDQENTTYFAAADRIIAVGDVHGDLGALRNVLKLSKLIGSNDEWVSEIQSRSLAMVLWFLSHSFLLLDRLVVDLFLSK